MVFAGGFKTYNTGMSGLQGECIELGLGISVKMGSVESRWNIDTCFSPFHAMGLNFQNMGSECFHFAMCMLACSVVEHHT
jgi:hypothetical protein